MNEQERSARLALLRDIDQNYARLERWTMRISSEELNNVVEGLQTQNKKQFKKWVGKQDAETLNVLRGFALNGLMYGVSQYIKLKGDDDEV